MTKKALIIVVIIGVILGIAGRYGFLALRPPLGSSAAAVSGIATSTVSTSTITTSTPVDVSDWLTYSSSELGFTIQYPSDLIVNSSNPTAFQASFPATRYFPSGTLDNVSVSVAVSSTCPKSDDDANAGESETMSINGNNFTIRKMTLTAAGSITAIATYDTIQNNACYRITFNDYNAGSMTADRATELSHVNDIFGAMISSFTFIYTPTGNDESDYNPGSGGSSAPLNPSGPATPATNTPVYAPTISINTISPSPVSVGGKLTITGQGFTGHDTIVRISDGSVSGVLWGGMPTSDAKLVMTVPDKACTAYTGGSGLTCPSYLVLSPGTYVVTVNNQNGTTDSVYLKIQ